eukprot:scaffold7595_cov267-Pinguiococcus_pyrenoidosus.AAC.9
MNLSPLLDLSQDLLCADHYLSLTLDECAKCGLAVKQGAHISGRSSYAPRKSSRCVRSADR